MAAGGAGDASRRGTTLPSAHDEPLSTISGGSREAASPLGKRPHWAQPHPGCAVTAVLPETACSGVFARERRALRKVRLKVPRVGRKAGDPRAQPGTGGAPASVWAGQRTAASADGGAAPRPEEAFRFPPRGRHSLQGPLFPSLDPSGQVVLWPRPSLSASARGDASSGEHATLHQGAGPLGSRPGGHGLAHGITAPVGP